MFQVTTNTTNSLKYGQAATHRNAGWQHRGNEVIISNIVETKKSSNRRKGSDVQVGYAFKVRLCWRGGTPAPALEAGDPSSEHSNTKPNKDL